ncbi:hypothetical protein DFH07DRAFT_680307, partial [Mycena maculata]
NLPILEDDSSNWISWAEQITTYGKSKGLGRHISGTVRKPGDLMQNAAGETVIANTNVALTDEQIEAHEKKQEDYETKEAKFRHIVYSTVSATRFNQIKSETTASRLCAKLTQLNQN